MASVRFSLPSSDLEDDQGVLDDAFAAVLDKVLSDCRATLLLEHSRSSSFRQDNTQEEKPPWELTLPIGNRLPPIHDKKIRLVTSDMSDATIIWPAPSTDAPTSEGSEDDAAGSPNSMSRRVARISMIEEGFGGNVGEAMVQVKTLKRKVSLEDNELMQQCAQLHLSTLLRKNASENKPQPLRQRISSVLAHVGVLSHQPILVVDTLMSVVILLNAITIGANSDTSDWEGWLVINGIFCALFVLEFLIKLRLLGTKLYFCGADYLWHFLEVVLIVFAVFELAMELAPGDSAFRGSSLFRLFRLVRLTKLLRIFRIGLFADLILMLNGAMGGLRTLFWSIFLISLPLYIVALVLRETLGEEKNIIPGHGAESFSTLANAYFSIFRCVVAADCNDENGRPIFVRVSAQYGWAYGVIYAVTVVLMTFGLFNVIVAIYVENTVSAAKNNDAKRKENRLRDNKIFKEKSLELAMLAYSFKTGTDIGEITSGRIDLDGIYEMEITQPEFAEICENPGFSELLVELDIAADVQRDLFDTLDVDQGGTLDVHELIKGIAKLRGDPRKSDVVAVLLGVRHVSHLLATTVEILQNHTQVLAWLQETQQLKVQTKHQRVSDSTTMAAARMGHNQANSRQTSLKTSGMQL